MKIQLIAMMILLLSGVVEAQEKMNKVVGVVKSETGEPIPNVMISVEGKNKFTRTNSLGEFEFKKLTTTDSLIAVVPKLGIFKVGCDLPQPIEIIAAYPEEEEEIEIAVVDTSHVRNHRIHGKVQISESHEDLAHALVSVLDAKLNPIGKCETDSTGNFDLNVVGTGDYTLYVSYVGYSPSYTPLKFAEGDSVLSAGLIAMQEGVELREIEVVDRRAEKGKRTRIDLLTREDIKTSGAKDINSALRGKIPGIRIIRSAAPGGSSRVSVRGLASILNPTEPLVILDGVEIANDLPYKTGFDIVSESVPIEIVESIEVNKTGEGYGVRGANGVIIIKTIRGLR